MPTPKEDNPLWMLRTFYFVPCDLMYQNVLLLKSQFLSEDGAVRERVSEHFTAYLLYWFAGLFVTAEGWKEIKVSDPVIDGLINAHLDSLRLFRNGVFHFQPTDRKHLQFFDIDKFNWAEHIHLALRTFFAAQD